MKTRPAAALLVTITIVVTFFGLFRGDAHAQSSVGFQPGAEAEFVALINNVRAGAGVPALAVDGELVTNARNWSVTMMEAGDIFHTDDQSVGVSSRWQLLGENVGVGPDVSDLFDAFVASPTHYANIVNPDFDYIGVGVYWSGDRMWTVQRYRDEGAPVEIPQPDPPMTEPPVTEPPVTEPPVTEPPVTEPPVTEPPVTEPPVTEPPTTVPPVTTSPAPVPTPTTVRGSTARDNVSERNVDALTRSFTDALRLN